MDAWKESKPHLTGFGHHALLSNAETIVKAIKSGDLTDIFVIGGCDGTEKSRSYFSDLAKLTPQTSVILTLGCGKFRLRNLELGNFAGTHIPRIIDCGQCNDAYSAVVVALKLAEALNTDLNSLPLHFAVSWFEQKAVAVLLSLLHLGVKNIRLGPTLPAFLTPNVQKYLVDNLNLRPASMGHEKEDMELMLARR
ncbi:hybrid cluster protein [Reticulomyxa filosa]|uniref:Hybrid cluster protein n=1 Tax=Reticulomyxa filosa TaxID=46433 RepID=X6NR27_RETFI|nr:hybrid cluster protein [Reticulomyxa filosa]|eukprot:ETO28446.1 hybrid cluster protein [Reticulomyxa filosa]